MTKQELVESIRNQLTKNSFTVAEVDATRPWGAFLRVVNSQADRFIATYFAGVTVPPQAQQGERSPKILLVAPRQRLSWQHHDRRSEFWRVVNGKAGVYLSETNQHPPEMRVLHQGDTVEIPQGVRHRLVGLDEWSVVAEIWIHTDPRHPSDEQDIYRHQDDYQR